MKSPYPQKAMDLLKERPDLADVYGDIREDLERVEESLKLFTSSPNRLVSEINTYLFQRKGKRIRPAILLLCSRLLRYQGDEHILMAALVEFIHTASLIHDDIIDHADTRRGRDSVHARWGAGVSVLLGDYLYIKSLGLSLENRHPQIIRLLTDVSSQMIEGELTEYEMSGNLEMAEQQYLDIIHNKTASLFSTACQIGGIIAEASREEQSYLFAYGHNLGMTFQIVDDLLDFKGDEKQLGKPTLSDLAEGRITLPLIYSLNSDGNPSRRRLQRLLENRKSAEETKQEILGIVESTGALDYTFRRAEEYSLKAREIITQFPASSHREALSLLSEYILAREK
jgi:octaprenyl-diphosphate synthase